MEKIKSGKLVRHLKNGKRGRTYTHNGLINGKVPVYFETGDFTFSKKAILCNIQDLQIIGYID